MMSFSSLLVKFINKGFTATVSAKNGSKKVAIPEVCDAPQKSLFSIFGPFLRLQVCTFQPKLGLEALLRPFFLKCLREAVWGQNKVKKWSPNRVGSSFHLFFQGKLSRVRGFGLPWAEKVNFQCWKVYTWRLILK